MNVKIMTIVTGIVVLVSCGKANQTSQVDTMQQATDNLTGKVTYRERKMLPPGAELTVTLEDVSKMDIASTIIASTSQSIQGGPPYSFSLSYDQSAIDERMQYSVRAKILLANQLLFTSTERIDPFKNADHPIEIMLSMAGGHKQSNTSDSANHEVMSTVDTGLAVVSVNPLADLVNTYWKLISIGDNAITMDSKQKKEAFLQLTTENNMIKGFAGCNNYTGHYQIDGNSLSFGAIASTKKACLSGMDTESQLMLVLSNTAYYSIHKNTLTLLNQLKKPTATFNAMYFN